MGFRYIIYYLGHECGHNAFSSNSYLNHTVGYILHSVLLVPYFSWKWSHYVHHNKNNHIFEGETHVPVVYDEKKCATIIKLHHYLGKLTPTFQAIAYLGPGWILYLLIGATGGPGRGKTNHFIVPNGLFPASKVAEVHFSTFGVILTLIGLYQLGKIYTFSYVFLLYFPVWTAVNMYLTTITLLQHVLKLLYRLKKI
jgi:omega-6 fatty acid desaturase (delta-12 desaturase)